MTTKILSFLILFLLGLSSLGCGPRTVEEALNQGDAAYERGNLDRAITDYSKAIQLDPGLSEAYFGRGIAYHD